MPVVCAILVLTLVGLFKPFINGNKMPNLVAADVNAYAGSAHQLPIKPSPALYHVPVAHPPDKIIPIPNINDPIIVPINGYDAVGISTIPVDVRINRPIL